MANAIFFARGRGKNLLICALCIFAFLQGLRGIHYKVYKLFLSSCAYRRVAALIERCKKFFHFERVVASVCICRAKGGYKKFFHSKKNAGGYTGADCNSQCSRRKFSYPMRNAFFRLLMRKNLQRSLRQKNKKPESVLDSGFPALKLFWLSKISKRQSGILS